MKHFLWIRSTERTAATESQKNNHKSGSGFLLSLEELEERTVPSHFAPVSGTASGTGSWDFPDPNGDGGTNQEAFSGAAINQSYSYYDATSQQTSTVSIATTASVKNTSPYLAVDLSCGFDGVVSGSESETWQIMPDTGDQPNASVTVEVNLASNGEAGGSGPTISVTCYDNGTQIPPNNIFYQFPAKIGDKITVSDSVTVPPYQDAPGSYGSWWNEEADLAVSTASNVTASKLTWDAVKGGVDSAYTVSGGPLSSAPVINYYWSPDTNPLDGERFLGPVKGVTRQYHLSPAYLTPPAGTKYLLMDVSYSGTDSILSLAYNPAVTAVTDHDGATEGETTFGRFFSGVPVSDETFTLTVSDEVAALRPATSTIKFGTQTLTLHPVASSPTEYTTAEDSFDPKTAGPLPVTAVFAKGSTTLLSTQATSFDVVAPAKWLADLAPAKLIYNEEEKQYALSETHDLLKLSADQFKGFGIPAIVGTWLLATKHSGVTLHAMVDISAPFNPTDEKAYADVYGEIDFQGIVVDTPHNDVDVKLDQHNLDVQGSMVPISVQTPPVEAKITSAGQLKLGVITISPQNLTADIGVKVDLILSMNSQGQIDYPHSSLALTLTVSNITGGLKLDFLPETASNLLDNLEKVPIPLPATVPPAIISALNAFGLGKLIPQPQISASLAGTMSLAGTFGFDANGTPILSSGPTPIVHLTPTVTFDISWLGQVFTVADLSFLAADLSVNYSPPPGN